MSIMTFLESRSANIHLWKHFPTFSSFISPLLYFFSKKCEISLAKMGTFCYHTLCCGSLRDQVPVKEVQSWLNVQSVKRLLTSEITWATPIEDPTRSGKQTLNPLRLKLMEELRRCMYVLLAYVLALLKELNWYWMLRSCRLTCPLFRFRISVNLLISQISAVFRIYLIRKTDNTQGSGIR